MELQQRWLSGQPDYKTVWQAMQDYTNGRNVDSPDEIWYLEHAPVYTLGQAAKPEHILNPQGIPIVQTDRGGQVTYHGPGQLMAYCLIDLRRQGLYVKQYIAKLEEALINTLAYFGIGAYRKEKAPGVYVRGAQVLNSRYAPSEFVKIAALGVKIRNGRSYHGLSLNVDMDLNPFTGINPCGYKGLGTTDMRSCGQVLTLDQVGQVLSLQLRDQFTLSANTAHTKNTYDYSELS